LVAPRRPMMISSGSRARSRIVGLSAAFVRPRVESRVDSAARLPACHAVA
jgi:hypothetical protein